MPITAETLTAAGLPGGHYKTFIETGFYKGEGAQAALDAGFEHVYSVEIMQRFADAGRELFAGDPRVLILHANSLDGLKELSQVFDQEDCVFWLDAHSMEGPVLYSPVLLELDIIAEQMRIGGARDHTILIDDRRLVRGTQWVGVTDSMIMLKLRTMFPNRLVTYLDGFVKKDIYASIPVR